MKRYGKQRQPGCKCERSFTCEVCLNNTASIMNYEKHIDNRVIHICFYEARKSGSQGWFSNRQKIIRLENQDVKKAMQMAFDEIHAEGWETRFPQSCTVQNGMNEKSFQRDELRAQMQ